MTDAYLCETDEEATDGGDDDDTDKEEGDVLRPEFHVDVETEHFNGNLAGARDWVNLAHAIEGNVDAGHHKLVEAVQGEDVSKEVEPAALDGFRLCHAFTH